MDIPFAITLRPGSSLANRTGAWRDERPVYRDLIAPCGAACPAGEDVRRWLSCAGEAGYEAAWRQIMADNPLPAVMGRICYHPCETACNRAQLDGAVGINAVERFLGDEAIRHGWTVPVPAAPPGRRVLVVGSGPAGLSAAYHLTLLGHRVTVREAAARPGGMMRYGIPRYRLPREVLDAEVDRILAMGVDLELGTTVSDTGEAMREGGFSAVFLAVGAQLARRAYLPACDGARVLDALGVLRGTEGGAKGGAGEGGAEGGAGEGGEPPRLGRHVVVYGGGNTALDTARTARRLGAADPLVVYRRTRERMPAHAEEVADAEQEGIRFRWLSTITGVGDGHVTVERMRLDESGFPQPTGRFDRLDADSVVLALGQYSDLTVLNGLAGVETDAGAVRVGPDLMTGCPGVFAGGDLVRGERTATVAVGHGASAARHLDAWLRGTAHQPAPPPEPATYDSLNTWYYTDAPPAPRPHLAADARTATFAEVVGGLDEPAALYEARRCLSCGHCFECDNCYGVCPDNAVINLGPGQGYAIDYDYCKGCGLCVAECPSGAIAMRPEQS